MKTWQDIWSSKGDRHDGEDFSLAKLMELDGYDISCSSVNESDFVSFADVLIQKLELTESQSLLEIGCGAGALGKVVVDRGIRYSGVDYTKKLVDICREAVPGDYFLCAEAAKFELPKKDFDAVVSHSVFHYFPSDDYAVEAFQQMVEHTRVGGIIALTDMHDKRLEEEHHARRKAMIGEKEYQRLYSELSHNFYYPEIFEEAARKSCQSYWLEEQFLGSESGKFKFNFFARR